jgi:NAD(P)-dependent dehydrogenase (short-subunit alcohol dehydrogenase family)
MSTALIIGGTSGLGLELAHLYRSTYDQVFVTGRSVDRLLADWRFVDACYPKDHRGYLKVGFHYLPISNSSRSSDPISALLSDLPKIDLLIYAAGVQQRALIDKISEHDIELMTQIGLSFPARLLHHLLRKQKNLPGFIAITSTSEHIPRREEPVYAAVKAGLGMLARSVALDERVGKVLITAPAGMNTPFWDGRSDVSTFLDPAWVAGNIFNIYADLYRSDAKCRSVKILRQPERIEFVEKF